MAEKKIGFDFCFGWCLDRFSCRARGAYGAQAIDESRHSLLGTERTVAVDRLPSCRVDCLQLRTERAVRQAGNAGDASNAGIDAVEQRRFASSDQACIEAQCRARRAERLDAARFLRLVLIATLDRNLTIRPAKHRIEHACLHLKRSLSRRDRQPSTAGSLIELLGLPRSKSFLQLFGELGWICGGFEGERRYIARKLMMAVTVCRRPRVSGINHERSEHPDDAHHVGQRLALVPLASCFGERLRKAVVERPPEKLPPAIEAPRLQQLFRPNDAERVEKLGANEVLTTLAASERQERHPRVIATCKACKER